MLPSDSVTVTEMHMVLGFLRAESQRPDIDPGYREGVGKAVQMIEEVLHD